MGLISMGAYSTTVRIPQFIGLNQHGDGIGTDPRYAVEATNVFTKEGYFRPMAKCQLLEPMLNSPIETLARLHRRWHTTSSEKDVFIAASDGQLYWALPTDDAWTPIALPDGWSGVRYASDKWSTVSYEINPEGSEAPVDVLLMSNAKDGMICVRGDDMTVSIVPTPKKFGVIARYAERIWGGAIDDDPDMLVYSAPYDPFDWAQNDAIPEDGAGDIQQPSWDGDGFQALTPFGSQLIAFKRTKVWRILGTNPGEYVFREQYGGGTAYPQTVAVDVARVLMLGRDGLMQYNGESVNAYYQEYAKRVFERLNPMVLDKAVACLHRGVYYCALPLDGSQDCNAVLMYDTVERSWLLREGVEVEAFLSMGDDLYFTSATTPGRVWIWREDSWRDGNPEPIRWVSGWQDFGSKNIAKGGYLVYLTVENPSEVTVQLKISIETEKKLKTKLLAVPPGAGKAKQRKLTFGGSGRRFRIIIESDSEAEWRLLGGMQLEVETDVD